MDSAIHGICGIRLDGERLDVPPLYHVMVSRVKATEGGREINTVKSGNGWEKDKAFIEFRQQDLNKKVDDIYEKLWDMNAAIAGLKVKASIWGAVGGIITTAAGMLVYLFRELIQVKS